MSRVGAGRAAESPHCCVSSDGGKEGAGDAGLSRREMPELPGPGSPANACLFLPLRPLQAPCRGQTRHPGDADLGEELPRAGWVCQGLGAQGLCGCRAKHAGWGAFTGAESGLGSALHPPQAHSAHWRLLGPSPLFPRSSSHLSPLTPRSVSFLKPCLFLPLSIYTHTGTHGIPSSALVPYIQ